MGYFKSLIISVVESCKLHPFLDEFAEIIRFRMTHPSSDEFSKFSDDSSENGCGPRPDNVNRKRVFDICNSWILGLVSFKLLLHVCFTQNIDVLKRRAYLCGNYEEHSTNCSSKKVFFINFHLARKNWETP